MIDDESVRDVIEELARWSAAGEEIALATLLRVRGSAPRPPGARFAMTRSALVAGSVSGGCVEGDLYERGLKVLDGAPSEIARYGFADEDAFEVGLSCGGTIDVLVERHVEDEVMAELRACLGERRVAALIVAAAPEALRGRRVLLTEAGRTGSLGEAALDAELDARAPDLLARVPGARVEEVEPDTELYVEVLVPSPRLYIVGATHTAVPLCAMAKQVGFEVTVVDPRTAFASRERFPAADAIEHTWPDAAFADRDLGPTCAVVTLTHDPKFDLPALAAALASGASYIGALGSRATHARRRRRLAEQGFDEDALDRIRGPVGLDLGARTPEEVAVAILSEIIAVRRGRDGGPLRERSAPIHDR